MIDKQFVTSYDKGYEEFAELLETLVSEKDNLMNLKLSKERFRKDRQITSSEYVLTIGKKGTKVNRSSFHDLYNKYGIHIGFRGRKAWLFCEKFRWSDSDLEMFNKEIIGALIDLNMSTQGFDPDLVNEMEKGRASKGLVRYAQSSLSVAIVADALNKIDMYEALTNIKKWIDNIRYASERRKQQYKLAIVLFYLKFLNDFLGLKEKSGEPGKE